MKAWKIGRSRDAEITLAHSSVSRNHAELVETKDHRYYLTDCNSSLGTFVSTERKEDWRRIRQSYVTPDDGIRLGEFETDLKELLNLVPEDSVPREPEHIYVVEKETESEISSLPHGPVERDPLTGKIIRRS